MTVLVQPRKRDTEDLAAERAVLGAVLGDNTVAAAVAEVCLLYTSPSPRD